MKKTSFSRRQFLKGAGALIVGFNLFPRTPNLFGQTTAATADLDPQALDSWIAVNQDGTVTVFTSKVELGTGIETALAQIAAEELEVSWQRVKVVMGDTAFTVDQSATGGSRTIERAGPQIRQAAAAARKLSASCELRDESDYRRKPRQEDAANQTQLRDNFPRDCHQRQWVESADTTQYST